jgi:putative spermidine/putrescine transport system permease protein
MGTSRKWAAALVLPALLLLAIAFLAPLVSLLSMAVSSPDVRDHLSETATLLREWDGEGTPPEATYATLSRELAEAQAEQRLGAIGTRLNFEQTGLRGLLLRTARADLRAPYREAMIRLDPRWGDGDTWRIIRQAASPVTATYLLRSVDLRLTPSGAIARVEPDAAIFLPLFQRSFIIGGWVTVLCLLLAYPVAYTLTTLPRRWAAIGVGFVLVPFWTSILVRSISWFILLQREGPLNAAMLALGLIDHPIGLIFTRFAVVIAMVHVLLPFAILPLYSVMKRLDPAYLRAAASLGAPPWMGFLRVYLPLSMPGVLAAGIMVFMLSVGFYVTPALVGGPQDQMVSYFIAFFTNTSINWNMAAALSVLLLAATGVLVAILRRLAPGLDIPGGRA